VKNIQINLWEQYPEDHVTLVFKDGYTIMGHAHNLNINEEAGYGIDNEYYEANYTNGRFSSWTKIKGSIRVYTKIKRVIRHYTTLNI
jgi:hypothetical protein